MSEASQKTTTPRHAPLRRALVLAGGGAKGAYAFGAMKAFRDAKLFFHSVGGASVGALNAIIWSTREFERGEALWHNLSFSTVYPMKMLDPKRHRQFFVRGVAYVYVSLRVLWSSIQGIPIAGESSETRLFAWLGELQILLVGLMILSELLACYLQTGSAWAYPGLILGFFFIGMSEHIRSREQWLFTGMPTIWSVILARNVGAKIHVVMTDFGTRGVVVEVILGAVCFSGIALLASKLYRLPQRIFATDVAVLQQSPLKD